MIRNIFIITMFPEIYDSFIETGVIGKALRSERGQIKINLEPLLLSDFSKKGFQGVDDSSYGGGPGMVIRADILKEAYNYVLNKSANFKTIYLTPCGKTWNRDFAYSMAASLQDNNSPQDLLFICGRYEGIDQRFIDKYIDQEISLGDFVLSCGDWALLSILDSMLRFIPGVVGDYVSVLNDSFEFSKEDRLLDHPHYTKPAIFEDIAVPDILRSGNHKKIEQWRQEKKLEITKEKRPDLKNKAQIKVNNKESK